MAGDKLTKDQIKILEDWGLEIVRLKLYTPMGAGAHPLLEVRIGSDNVSRDSIEKWILKRSKFESLKLLSYNILTLIAAIIAAVAGVWQLIISL